MKTLLWLDDVRDPDDNMWARYIYNVFGENREDLHIVWAKSYKEFKEYFDGHLMPDFVSFDHDLADEHYEDLLSSSKKIDYDSFKEKTGVTAATYLCSLCRMKDIKELPEWHVHSANPVGKLNIESVLNTYKKVHYGEE